MTFFEPGTRVLAYHGPLVYEAKVMQSFEIGKKVVVDSEGKELPIPEKLLEKNLQSSNAYLLHYKGWKSKWDEWVEQARVLDYSEESLALQKELKQRVTKAKQPPPASDETTKKRSKTKTTGSTPAAAGAGAVSSTATLSATSSKTRNGTPPTKRKKTSALSSSAALDISLPISQRLKYTLVDGWENITKHKILVNIPSTISVSEILKEYRSHSPTLADVLDEILDGLEKYFNASIGLILLYKFERLQYLNVIKNNTENRPMSEIYGMEHLLRLFTSLPGLIAQTSMDPVSIKTIIDESKEILKFIDDNLPKYSNSYINVTPDYENLAQ